MNLKNIKLLIFLPIIFIIIYFIPKGINLWIDFQWFKEVGYEAVFIKTLLVKIAIALGSFLIAFFVVALTLSIRSKFTPKTKVTEQDNIIDIGQSPEKISSKLNYGIIFSISFIVAILFSLVSSTNLWDQLLIFLNQVPFGLADPVFNKDISFYTFSLAFFESIFSFILFLFFLIAFVNIAYTILVLGLGKLDFKTALRQFGFYFVFIFILIAFGYVFKMFNIVYAPHEAFYGAGFTNLKITIPYYIIAIITCFISAAIMFFALKKGNKKLLVIAPVLLIAVIFVGVLSQSVVQKFIVQPNEIRREEPYIEKSMEMTSKAFGLDDIEEIEYTGDADLTAESLKDSDQIISNIRINDVRPAKTIYNQLQSIRPYYSFSDVDIDRYKLNGQSTQVFISAREMVTDKLPSQAQTWISKYLKYTHGYGAVVSPANKISAQGQPDLILKDLPPKTTYPELEITRPEIYYGNYTNDYAIVNTLEKEFDYPSGNSNVESLYEGSAGIPLSFFNKVVFALNKADPKLLISNLLTKDSKILINRNIEERVRKIAPFFTYDDDPYLVIDEGKLYWIIDAYTSSNKYPYSEPISSDKWYQGANYIRNSIKVVINAYNGDTDFYLIDEEDPIAQTYAKTFPNLLKPKSDMAEGLQDHLRYPVDLFDIQTLVYRDYHMTNAHVFYNREDAWSIAKEIYNTDPKPQFMDPYYLNMTFPESDDLEFVLMRPFTPINKDQMVGWLGARNDGDKYGELVLFKFSKQKLVYGPMQIESRINQDSTISKELSLWDQKGSNVLRGNLLVIPLMDSLLYIEPLYIQADNENSLPEVKRIIVSYKEKIVMEETLAKSLEAIFGKDTSDEDEDSDSESADGESDDFEDIASLAEKAQAALEKAKTSSQAGDWAGYGEALEELEKIIKQLE